MNSESSQYRHHPYRDGYSVLPKLRRISSHEIFETDPAEHDCYIREKQLAMQNQKFCFQHNFDDSLRDVVTQFLVNNYPIELKSTGSLEQIVPQMQEDIIVHAIDGQRDWMAFGHLCFPSGWRPEEKIGKRLSEIHQPVPGMDLSNSRKLVETMVQHGPFERFVWSVVFEDELNFHPDIERARFDSENPNLFVKIERQVTVGLPKENGALFLLRQALIPIEFVDVPSLVVALKEMSNDELAYKGIAGSRIEVIAWLTEIAARRQTPID